MKLEYSEASPARIAAFGAHYTKELKAGRVFATLETTTGEIV